MYSIKKVLLKNFTKFTGKQLCGSLFYNKFAKLRTAILLKKKPTTSSFLWILQYFSKQPFCKTFAFAFKPKLTENVKQRFKKRFYVLTHIYLPKTSRSSFPYLSSSKSSVSLLQEFFLREVGALNILIKIVFVTLV